MIKNQSIKTFKISDGQLRNILIDFRSGEEILRHLPLDPVNSINPPLSLAFEVIPRGQWTRPLFMKRWFTAMRPVSLASSITPCTVAVLIGLLMGFEPQWWLVWPSLLGVISIHLGVNLLNDYEDHIRLQEVLYAVGTRGSRGSGVIQKAWIPALHLKWAGMFCLVLGVLFGLPALIKNPLSIGILGAVALLGAVSYSGWPFRLKYRAFGDGAVVLLLGPGVMIGMSLAAFDVVPLATVIGGIFFGFLAEGALHANNLQDIPIDTNRKIKTLAMSLGFKKAKIFLISIYLSSFGLLILFSEIIKRPVISLACVLVSPYVGILLMSVRKADGPLSSSIRGLKQKAERVHLFFGSLVIISLVYLIYF